MFAEWGCHEYPLHGSGAVVDALVQGMKKFGRSAYQLFSNLNLEESVHFKGERVLGPIETGRSGLDCGGWSALFCGLENMAEHGTLLSSVTMIMAYGGNDSRYVGSGLGLASDNG